MANPVGRPLLFATPEILDEKIDAYFADCEQKDEQPFITGLAVWLDTSRHTLINYKERPEFVNSIKRALQKCEMAVEKGAMQGKFNSTFSIFNLKNNYGWRDETHQDITTGGKPILGGQANVQTNVSDTKALEAPEEN